MQPRKVENSASIGNGSQRLKRKIDYLNILCLLVKLNVNFMISPQIYYQAMQPKK